MKPLYSAFQNWTGGLSLSRSHWLTLTTCSKRGPPCCTICPALWVFTWNNSTAAVGTEQGPGKRERGGDSKPKMDMANLFKHFFREFSTFLAFCSSLKCYYTSVVVSFCLKFERFFSLTLWRCWRVSVFFCLFLFPSPLSDFSLWL